MLRPFERTAGDEFQGVLDDPAALAAVVERLLREDSWNIGIGIGEVEEPLPESTRAGRGPAYVHAREAVTAAKSAPWRLRVAGDDPEQSVRALETTLWLWAAVLGRRTSRGWEVADLVDAGRVVRRGREAARRHPVGDQPARPGGRHRRGTARPRAGHRARRWPAAGSRPMSPDNTTQLVLALLGFALVAGTLGWSPTAGPIWPPVSRRPWPRPRWSRRSPTSSRPTGSR